VNSRWLIQQQKTPDGLVDSAVHPAGDSVLSAVSDDKRYPRQRYSSLLGTLAPCCAETGPADAFHPLYYVYIVKLLLHDSEFTAFRQNKSLRRQHLPLLICLVQHYTEYAGNV